MKYKAMAGTVIVKFTEKEAVTKRDSGLLVVESGAKQNIEIAEIIAVGDAREDVTVGMKIVFPSATGFRLEAGVYYLKYEDICAIVDE